MRRSRLSNTQLKKLYHVLTQDNVNIMRSARLLGIARNTVKRHRKLLQDAGRACNQISMDFKSFLKLIQTKPPAAADRFQQLLPELASASDRNLTVKQLWLAYREVNPAGYCYSQFACHYSKWSNAVLRETGRQGSHELLRAEDIPALENWRRSTDRRKWEKAVVLLDTAKGHSVSQISGKIERSADCIRNWISTYQKDGLGGIDKKKRVPSEDLTRQILLKKENLIRLLHEAPALHGYNRTSWRLKDLSAAYYKNYSTHLSVPTISAYIRQEGYVFRKARKVLTSPDPDFREKLTRIQMILGRLGPDEKFFSIDEFGPFSVKIRGGRSLVKRGEAKIIPQHQVSKGFLICTAALELSTNQITHFYSRKKDTEEMIKLIEMLCSRYRDQQKLYLSWDAAIWHASKKLKAHLEEINEENYRSEHHTPTVELAPLPASAQFLNVIESVFSGLAKSVIHHSDYASAGHCQAAIDRYFRERNEYFALHPKKAGKKIWGKEKTIAEFRDSNNCKDTAWR